MSKRVDIKNQIFGDIYVLEFLRNEGTHAKWKCLCMRCNSLMEATYVNLKSGNTKSCQSCGNTTHGKSNNILYRRWQALKERDNLCEAWLDAKTFINDVYPTFEKGYSLRRFDTTKPHSLENSYWAKPRKSRTRLSEKVCFL